MTTDAVAQLRKELEEWTDGGVGGGLALVNREDLRDVLDRLEQVERERDVAQIVAINDGQKLLELRERLEAAENGDIWVAFTPDGMPREVCRQTFEPSINPRVGRWVRCVQVKKLRGQP